MFNDLKKVFELSLSGALSTQQLLINNEALLLKRGINIDLKKNEIFNSKTYEKISFMGLDYIYSNKSCNIEFSKKNGFSIKINEELVESNKPQSINIFKISDYILDIKKYLNFYRELKNISYPKKNDQMLECWKNFYDNNSLYQDFLTGKREYDSQDRILEILISNYKNTLEDSMIQTYKNFKFEINTEKKYNFLSFFGDLMINKIYSNQMTFNKETRDIVLFYAFDEDFNYQILNKALKESLPEIESLILNEFKKIKAANTTFYLLSDYFLKNLNNKSVNIEEIELSILSEDSDKYVELYKVIELVKKNEGIKCSNNYNL